MLGGPTLPRLDCGSADYGRSPANGRICGNPPKAAGPNPAKFRCLPLWLAALFNSRRCHHNQVVSGWLSSFCASLVMPTLDSPSALIVVYGMLLCGFITVMRILIAATTKNL